MLLSSCHQLLAVDQRTSYLKQQQKAFLAHSAVLSVGSHQDAVRAESKERFSCVCFQSELICPGQKFPSTAEFASLFLIDAVSAAMCPTHLIDDFFSSSHLDRSNNFTTISPKILIPWLHLKNYPVVEVAHPVSCMAVMPSWLTEISTQQMGGGQKVTERVHATVFGVPGLHTSYTGG